MTNIKVSGSRDEGLKEIGYGGAFGGIEVSDAVLVSADRADSTPQLIKGLKPEDVVELIYEADVHRWIRVGDLEGEFKNHLSRGGDPDVLEIPVRLPTGDSSRGVASAALEALRVLKFDPMAGAAGKVVELFDKKLMPEPGFYRFDKGLDRHSADLKSLKLKGDAPILLFIHGTFSNTSGGFGSLQPEAWKSLQENYGDRIFGYDHYTLSKSPVENALDLIRRLPNKVKLHIVSHSRGGLVGELLCRGSRKDRKEPFDKLDETLVAENTAAAQALPELARLLKSKSITVDRFVRVACPARGTALASARMDRWLEAFINVVGKFLPPGASFPVSVLTDLLLQFKKQSANPEAMPGLASMNPESNFIKMINRPDVEVNTDLTVISGDVEKTSLAGRMALFFADVYYGGEHDLVVNTPAMYGGPVRSDKKGRFFFDKGPEVNHCNYFNNKTTADILRDALILPAGKLDSREFKPLSEAFDEAKPSVSLTGRSFQKRDNLPQPVVYVLPGIMGTHLAKKGNRIWLDLLDLAGGGLGSLKIGEQNIEPEALIDRSYGNLVEFLSATHETIPFPYDWRKSILVEANRFAKTLEAKLKQTDQPIRIVAHSMGGLVTRAMIGLRPDVWEEIAKRPGARFVMLGTPNKGAYKIPRVVFGQDKTLHALAAVDLLNSPEKLLEVIVGFTGFLQLLPMDEGGPWNFAEPDTWNKFPRAGAPLWTKPRKDDLDQVRELRRVLESGTGKIRDWDPIIYVAGFAPNAPAGVEIADVDGRKQIVFRGTNQGDGTVPWESGILPEMKKDRIFYMDAAHGDMANHKPSFAAIHELLNDGTTAILEKEPPRSLRGMEDSSILRGDTIEIYPTQQDLETVMLGASPVTHRVRAVKPVKVSVLHGDLSFCEYAVAVGHYEGDGLYSAEKHLDHHLKGKLNARHEMGRYPGPEGSVEVILRGQGEKPGGAIVVGLGKAGELTPRKLSAAFANALAEFGMKVVEQGPVENGEIKMASLLIGTGSTGLSVRNSVDALLNGVARANKSFAQLTADGYNVRISEIQFVELFKDQAVQAVWALDAFMEDGRFSITPTVQTMKGGWKRITYEEAKGWWNRITIRSADESRASLIFSVPADRARTEDSLLEVQRRNMDRLITQAVKSPHWNQSLATALFELMVPNGLKGSFKDLSNVLFVVDREAAHYPWELLYDPRSGEELPVVIQAGMIRQFSTSTFRERVNDVQNKSMMVVGNPDKLPPGFSDLPGAQQEGMLVAAMFKENGFEVQSSIKSDSSDIMSKMFSKDYRVLHLAGHGVFEYAYKESPDAETENFTGMVLGEGVFLTASEIRKKTNIPELVFINCCHLGRISSDAKEEDRTSTAFNKFAASLSEELIKMGVRAVVAAGWAVDDAAALTFAEAFYDDMFKGRSFGEAVKQARKVTYYMHKDRTNTWGAYQCYGDPQFQLTLRTDEGAVRKEKFVDFDEAILKINQQYEKAKTTSTQGIEKIENGLRAMRDAIATDHEEWLKDARMLGALGEAFGELFLFEEAVKYYEEAIKHRRAHASIRAIEQAANLTNRLAVQQVASNPSELAKSRGMITGQINRIKKLMKAIGDTNERWAIIGGGHKRLAQISATKDPAACITALTNMEKAYREAYKLKEGVYPLTNALIANLVRSLRTSKPTKQKLKGLKAEAALALKLAEADAQESRDDFWARTSVADARLCSLLLTSISGGRKTVDPRQYDRLREEYESVWRQFGSARELNSIIEHYAFLVATLPTAVLYKDLRAAVEKITAALNEMYKGE